MGSKAKLLLVLFMLFCFVVSGCSSDAKTETSDKKEESMFATVDDDGIFGAYRIVYHKETKVMYAVSAGTYNQGTFTVLLDSDGKPLTYKEEEYVR